MSDDVIRLDHVAFGVPKLEGVVPFVVDVLGGVSAGAGPAPGYQFWQWEFDGAARRAGIRPRGFGAAAPIVPASTAAQITLSAPTRRSSAS